MNRSRIIYGLTLGFLAAGVSSGILRAQAPGATSQEVARGTAGMPAAEVGALKTLHVSLQEGFANDQVTVAINGQQVLDEQVTTHPMHGHATSFEAQVPEGTVTIDLRVPSRNLSRSLTVDVHDTVYLGVAIRDGLIEHRLSNRPFVYF
jgi:hypothetical protein